MRSLPVCEACGTPLDADIPFCPGCGSLVRPATSAAPRARWSRVSIPSIPQVHPVEPRSEAVDADRTMARRAALPADAVDPGPTQGHGAEPVDPGTTATQAADEAPPSDDRDGCWACGAANPAGRAFCRHCGVWLGTGAAPAAPAPTAASSQVRPIGAIGPTYRVAPRRRVRSVVAVSVVLVGVIATAGLLLPRSEPREEPPALAAAGAGMSTADATRTPARDTGGVTAESAAEDATTRTAALPEERATTAPAQRTGRRSESPSDERSATQDDVERPSPGEGGPGAEGAGESRAASEEPPAAGAPASAERELEPAPRGLAAAEGVEAETGQGAEDLPSDGTSEPGSAAADATPAAVAALDPPDPSAEPAALASAGPSVAVTGIPDAGSPAGASTDDPGGATGDPLSDDAADTEAVLPGDDDADPFTARGRPSRGWVCEGAVRLDDRVGGTWRLGRISFVNSAGYERVVMHLQRAGSSSGGASATAEAFPTSAIRRFAPMASRPTSGGVTIGLDLEDGVRSGLGLRRYRPQGMRTVRELSVYRFGGNGTKVLVSVASEGCFRLRASGWRGPGDTRSARINLDVRP